MLTFTVSFGKGALRITVHIQYPGLELTSPAYCSTRTTTCYVSPSQQTATGTIIAASFGMDSKCDFFEGALIYKLQRKHATGTDNRPNNSVAAVNNTATNTYLLVALEVRDDYHGFCVCLIESTYNFILDISKLWALYREYNFVSKMHYKSNLITWLIHGNIVIKTEFDATYGLDCKLNIVISEGSWKHDILKPIKIDPQRSVLPLQILIVLMYMVSLYIQPPLKLDIYNQCSNIDLVSLLYTTGNGLERYRTLSHEVYAGNTMRFDLTASTSYSKSDGALIYKLQMRQQRASTEIDQDASNATYLLVAWKSPSSYKLDADVLLVEHDKRPNWNKNDLEYFYRKNIDMFRSFYDSTAETWLLGDNMILNIRTYREDRRLAITISELEWHSGAKMPVHVNPER
jgi:hypothetical protein